MQRKKVGDGGRRSEQVEQRRTKFRKERKKESVRIWRMESTASEWRMSARGERKC